MIFLAFNNTGKQMIINFFKKVFSVFKIFKIEYLSKIRSSSDAIDYFTNKSVVIIGPAASLDEALLSKVEKADICVFINKGYRLKSFDLIKKTAKKLILFHCLDQSEQTGGGKINSWKLRWKGFKQIVYPLNDDDFQGNIDTFHKENKSLLKLVRVKKTFYNEIKYAIGGFIPNTGAAAIYVASAAPGAKVYVHGITFYRTAYLEEYAPHLESLSETINIIETYGNHNPDLELLYFKSLVLIRNIEVDDELRKIIAQPYVPYFYQSKNEKDGEQ